MVSWAFRLKQRSHSGYLQMSSVWSWTVGPFGVALNQIPAVLVLCTWLYHSSALPHRPLPPRSQLDTPAGSVLMLRHRSSGSAPLPRVSKEQCVRTSPQRVGNTVQGSRPTLWATGCQPWSPPQPAVWTPDGNATMADRLS